MSVFYARGKFAVPSDEIAYSLQNRRKDVQLIVEMAMRRIVCLLQHRPPFTSLSPPFQQRRIVLIEGIIDCLVKDFGLVLRRVVVYPEPWGARHSVHRWPGQDSGSWM